MSIHGTGGVSPALLGALRRNLIGASDSQLLQVVAMVDQLAERGDVDALLAPLRPRLAQLRPARPLRFARLLFQPLDPLIVPARSWLPGTAAIPRTAIMPLANAVQAVMGDAGTAIEAMLAGHGTADEGVIQTVAPLLWPQAAAILAKTGSTCPPGWARAGLPETACASIAEIAAIVLRQASRIDALAHGALPGDTLAVDKSTAATLNAVLDQAQADGPVAWRVICLLLLRVHDKQAVLRAITTSTRQRDPAIRLASDQAVEAALDHLERHGPRADHMAADAASQVADMIALLNGVLAGGVGPARARRVAHIRAKLDTTCQTRMKAGLGEQVLAPLASLDAPGMNAAAAAQCLDEIEQAARSLRGLEMAGQSLGNAAPYAKLLQEAAEKIQATAPGAGLDPVDQARLVELLAGPEAGLAALTAARALDGPANTAEEDLLIQPGRTLSSLMI